MGKKMLIDATHAEETRVVVADGQKVDEFDFETIHRRQLAGNIYLAKVTRVEPSLQAAFVDYGGNRHGFLAFAEIHPDYYQIPMADREALLEEERAYAEAQREDEGGNGEGEKRSRRRSGRKDGKSSVGRGKKNAEKAEDKDQTAPVADEGAAADNAEAVTEAAPDTASENGTETSPEANPETGAATGPESEAAGASDTAAPADESAADKRQDPMPAPIEGKDPVATQEIGGMDIIDLDETGAAENTDDDSAVDAGEQASAKPRRTRRSRSRGAKDASASGEDDVGDDAGANSLDEPEPYRAADHAAEIDDQIESVADEDVSDELRPPRRPRLRRYKIQEVIKVRQIMLVQVVKEERGNKGAALTTYLSLAGRYCVLMPNTARGGGISRKITNATDRKKLKQIAGELEVPQGAGLIIRTAGANRTKAEIRRDYEYLSRLWDQIRDLTLKSIAPAPIYEEGDLIKRSIRDLYSRDIDEVLVEGEAGYRAAKAFMKMIMPSHARNVKLYNDPMPLFARYQVESYLAGMFNPTVQLKSGGYIVIGITEALVAIDVNSGKATRQGSIEETALQTNLEAAEEIARQLRLRDLAGLIVIDFIDMEERKNNNAVEKKLKDKLKDDRARIQVGRISGFGLLEMSRQRLRPGMLEATTQPCPHCHGTGLIRSDNSLGLTVLRAIEEEGTRRRSREVLVKAPVGIANYLINDKREHLAQIEARYGMAIRIEADPSLVNPDFTLEKFKTATRIVATASQPVVSFDAGTMQAVDNAEDEEEDEAVVAPAPEAGPEAEADSDGDGGGRGRRRRRRRRRGGQKAEERSAESVSEQGDDETPQAEVATDIASSENPADGDAQASEEAAPAKPVRRRSRRKPAAEDAAQEPSQGAPVEDGQSAAPAADAAPEAKPAARRRSRRKPDVAPEPETAAEPESGPESGLESGPEIETATAIAGMSAPVEPAPEADHAATAAGEQPAPAAASASVADQPEPDQFEQPVSEAASGPAAPPVAPDPAEEAPEPPRDEPAPAEAQQEDAAEPSAERPRRRGWWAFRR